MSSPSPKKPPPPSPLFGIPGSEKYRLPWRDTLNIGSRFFGSLSNGTTLTVQMLVSWIINLLAVVLFTIAGFVALVARRPFSGALLAILAILMWSGLHNAKFVDHRLVAIDVGAAKNDFTHIMHKAWTYVRDFDLPFIDIPRLDQWIDFPSDQKTTFHHRSLAAEYGSTIDDDGHRGSWNNWFHRSSSKPTYSVESAPLQDEMADVIVPSSYQREVTTQMRTYPVEPYNDNDSLGSFLRESGIATTFPVYKNAYQTARTNQLYFRPGADIETTLRNCRYVHKGGYIKFTLDSDGFVSGCFPIVR